MNGLWGYGLSRVFNTINGGIDVNIQDQNSDLLVLRFHSDVDTTTITTNTALHDRTFVVDDDTNIAAGSYLILFDPTTKRGLVCTVIDVATNTITIDRPLDFAYPSGTIVNVTNVYMNNDYSTNETIFHLRISDSDYDVEEEFDITQIRFLCQSDTGVELLDFGDIAALTNGITIRKKFSDGTYRNYMSVHSNGELQGAFGYFEPFDASNPGQGVYGFYAEWELAGQHNQGVTIRIGKGDDIEFVLYDDLSSLLILNAVAIGHIVE